MKNIPKRQEKIWHVQASYPVLSEIFAHELKISPVTAQLLINRGIYTVEQGRAFLGSELARLHTPYLLKDLKKAVDRILKAAGAGERILLYGDYDVDGITSTALLARVFQRLGADVHNYLPHRITEGYGLHLAPLQWAKENGFGLVITLDCGINALEEALWAQNNGLDLIITDHHEPPLEIPKAFAVVNPKRQDCPYPFKELAGVGVALKVAQAVLKEAGMGSEAWQEYLDLACLGTIADIVPLRGENRILVKHGLLRLARTENLGLRALMAASEVGKNNTVGTGEVGFSLAPRLNAAGRMGNSEAALRLLLTDNIAEAWEIASELNRCNQERQKIESGVLAEALHLLQAKPDLTATRVLVLASESWHAGVIGIVASRLVEMLHRPVLLIAVEGKEGKGSARSIPGFHLYQALENCCKHLLNFGGHAQAAGFTIDSGKVNDLDQEINHYAAKVLMEEKTLPRLELDGIIDGCQIDEKLIEELEKLSPFGQANQRPLLCCRKAIILESRGVGRNGSHLKLKLRIKNKPLDGIGFNLGNCLETVAAAEAVDLAFVPAINDYNGKRSIQLEVKDLSAAASLDILDQDEKFDLYSGSGYCDGNLELTNVTHFDLFTPEFVRDVLANKFFLPDSDSNQTTKELFRGLSLIDQRGILDRPAQLAKLASCGEPTLVITSCGYQTIELAHFLHLNGHARRDQTGCLNETVSGEQRDRIAARFETGQIKTVIATSNTAGSVIPHARELVLYHLPFNDITCSCLAETMSPDGRLYLLFGPEDHAVNKAWLEIMAPQRGCLAKFYSLLRQKSKEGTLGHTTPGDLARALTLTGCPHFEACTAGIALEIFQELGLLDKEDRKQTLSIKLLSAPSKKKDLHESRTYRCLQSIKNNSLDWMGKILNDPVLS
jgi:single-stranded-DNA-specific exonuclease